MWRCNVYQILQVVFGFLFTGAEVNITISQGYWNENSFECNTAVTLRCFVNPNTFQVQWFLGKQTVASSLDSSCVSSLCTRSSQFPGRYTYTYNDATGISDLKISNTSFDDDNIIYKCFNGTSSALFSATIKAPPVFEKIIVSLTNDINNTVVTVSTGCIYPVGDISIVWFSRRAGDHDMQTYVSELKEQVCSPISNCKRANTSLESILKINTTTHGDERLFTVNITFGSVHYSTVLGKYTVPLITDTSVVEKTCLPCWGYGVILAGILLVAVVFAILIKACYPNVKIGCLWYWEMSTLAGIFIVIIYLVIIIIVAGVYKKCEEINVSLECWKIYLVIFGIKVLCVTCCLFLYVLIEPVQSAKVISRKVEGKGMSVKIQWESRLEKCKTYYIQLEYKGKTLAPVEINRILLPGGFLEYELTGLILDIDYQAHLYSSVSKLPSLKKQISFDTKGRPMLPTKIYQDEQMRTEESITLRWTSAKGPKHHFIIKYKRSKRQNSAWVTSDSISSNWYTINGLRPGTSYTILVYSENTVGRSEESEPLFVKTRALKPVPPQDFKCTSFTENEVYLSWKPSKKIKNQQFLLTVFNNSEEVPSSLDRYEQRTCIKCNGEKTMTHTVSHLDPGSKYEFELFASAGNELSENSTVVTVETKGTRKEQLIHRIDRKQATATTVFHVNHGQSKSTSLKT